MNDYILEHHGIQGQKWGVRNGPPYPLSRGKSSSGGKKMGAAKPKSEGAGNIIKQKIKNKRDEIRKKKEEKRDKKVQENREKILKNPTSLYRNRDKFTTEEIKKANERLDAERTLKNLSVDDIKKGKQYLDAILGYGETALKMYEMYNRYKNTKLNNMQTDERTRKFQDALANAKKASKVADKTIEIVKDAEEIKPKKNDVVDGEYREVKEAVSKQDSSKQITKKDVIYAPDNSKQLPAVSSKNLPSVNKPKKEAWSGKVEDPEWKEATDFANRNREKDFRKKKPSESQDDYNWAYYQFREKQERNKNTVIDVEWKETTVEQQKKGINFVSRILLEDKKKKN